MNKTNSIITIVIPVYNDPEGLSETIESILSQKTDISYEVIIVDNNSTDDTWKVANSYAMGHDRVQVAIEDKIQSSYAARNTGIERAGGDIVVFIDADETVDENWLESAVKSLQKLNADYVGCNVKMTLPRGTLVGKYNAHTGFPVEKYLKRQNYAPTCALLVKREVFDDIGLFDARLTSGGDREFGNRVHEKVYEQGYAEDATVYHPARTTFNSLAKKNFRVGRGFCQKQRYYPERYGKPGIPPTPSNPSGGDDEDKLDSRFTRLAFGFLSITMLACRGMGYYYEFFFGEERDDIPAPTR